MDDAMTASAAPERPEPAEEALVRYRSIVETAVDGIITIHADGTIDTVNAAAERIFGYEPGELVGRNVSVLMPEPYRTEHDGYIGRFQATGESRIIGIGREVVGRRRDGSVFPLHLSVGAMDLGGRTMFTGIVHDVSERRRVEDELARIEARTRALAQEAALRRVAIAVARGIDPEVLFDLVASEVAHLLEVDVGLVCRFEEGRAIVVGSYGRYDADRVPELPIEGGGALAGVFQTGHPCRVDDYGALRQEEIGRVATRVGFRRGVAAGVRIGDDLWGGVLAATFDPGRLPPGSEYQLAHFAELAGLAIANASDRARLAAMAGTDPLTGLANHRTFQERLREEVHRADRYGRQLGLVLLDVDHFKAVNDGYGHQVGDLVLSELARRLRQACRSGELVARIGGEEFAWLLPETDAGAALSAAERARELIAATPFPTVGTVTVSGGTCVLAAAGDADSLVRFADGALYWAKGHGRNLICPYRPEVVTVLSPDERAAWLERQQALQSIKLLARAVDAKDPSTQRHSERVADIAVAIATALGWPMEDVTQLREAGLIHDVGKIGIPDAILLKPSRLTVAEFEQVKAHAQIGAEMVSDTLGAEQVAWVRGHHERWDGAGYPDGLAAEAIPAGARILALADSWDVMCSGRPYRDLLTAERALAECRRHSGAQFWPEAIEALARLVEAGALPGPPETA
jgi:diguanylate cyclase (GGDEF)-like protein/PAS domain S-box-containing protein